MGLLDDDDDPDATRRVCVDCGNGFAVSRDEAEWFEAKQMTIPRRCIECRRYRREMKAREGYSWLPER